MKTPWRLTCHKIKKLNQIKLRMHFKCVLKKCICLHGQNSFFLFIKRSSSSSSSWVFHISFSWWFFTGVWVTASLRSGADDIPNGNLWNIYLPFGVIKVHNLEFSSSNCSYQNPFELSHLKNIFAPAILAITSLREGDLKCSRRIALLRFRVSKQILNFPSSIALTHFCGLSYSFYHPCLFHSVKLCFHIIKHDQRDFSTCLLSRYCFVFQFYAYTSWWTTYSCK